MDKKTKQQGPLHPALQKRLDGIGIRMLTVWRESGGEGPASVEFLTDWLLVRFNDLQIELAATALAYDAFTDGHLDLYELLNQGPLFRDGDSRKTRESRS